jgi:hypothetical protein
VIFLSTFFFFFSFFFPFASWASALFLVIHIYLLEAFLFFFFSGQFTSVHGVFSLPTFFFFQRDWNGLV